MNEIKKIHLGRQPFTISVDAHKLLRDYLDEIEHQVGAKSEVFKEVELRMAELLGERGISGDKVILGEDVKYLKEQLGEPGDFKDDEHVASEPDSPQIQKRLFRDTHNAMIAGVCSGIAAFFGIDVTIVRLLFVVALLFGGAAIPLYIVLWLVMPEAKTPSDRLQMQGKAVTVDSLKEIVDRADVPAAADRAGRVFGRVIEGMGKVVLLIIGIGFISMAIAMFLGTAASGSYLFIHGGQIADQVVFPVGTKAAIGLVCGLLVLFLMALTMMVLGLAMIKRKWMVPGWVGAAFLGVFIIASALGTALAFDIAPQIRDRYNNMHHTLSYNVAPYKEIKVIGNEKSQFQYKFDKKSYVELQYFGKVQNHLAVSTKVDNGLLTVDASRYSIDGQCTFLCLYDDDLVRVIIHGPVPTSINVAGVSTRLASESSFDAESLVVTVEPSNEISIWGLDVDSMTATISADGGTQKVQLQGMHGAPLDTLSVSSNFINVDGVTSFTIANDATCDASSPIIYLNTMPQTVSVNKKTITSKADLDNQHNPDDERTTLSCIAVN